MYFKPSENTFRNYERANSQAYLRWSVDNKENKCFITLAPRSIVVVVVVVDGRLVVDDRGVEEGVVV